MVCVCALETWILNWIEWRSNDETHEIGARIWANLWAFQNKEKVRERGGTIGFKWNHVHGLASFDYGSNRRTSAGARWNRQIQPLWENSLFAATNCSVCNAFADAVEKSFIYSRLTLALRCTALMNIIHSHTTHIDIRLQLLQASSISLLLRCTEYVCTCSGREWLWCRRDIAAIGCPALARVWVGGVAITAMSQWLLKDSPTMPGPSHK